MTVKVSVALAQGDLSYKPHERSSSAGHTISTIIKGLEIRNSLAAKHYVDVSPGSTASYKAIIGEFEELSIALSTKLRQRR